MIRSSTLSRTLSFSFILSLTLSLLIGCNTIPTFPEYSESLKVACPELKLIKEDEQKLSEILNVVTDNYSNYHVCKAKVDAYLEWHKVQKKIYEDMVK